MESFIFISLKRRFVRIDKKDIIYVISVGHYVKIYTTNGPYMPLLDLKVLEARLPANNFVRINRGTIVALDRVIWFDSYELAIDETTTFMFGDKYFKEFRKHVPVIMMEKNKSEIQQDIGA